MRAELRWIIERRCALVLEWIAEKLQHCPADRMGQCRYHIPNPNQRLRQCFGDVVYRADGNARLLQARHYLIALKTCEYARELVGERGDVLDARFAVGEARIRRQFRRTDAPCKAAAKTDRSMRKWR